MTIELWTLVGSVLLLFVLIMISQIHIDKTMGAKYALSNRTEPPTDTPFRGRIVRAIENLKENLILYTPLVLVLVMTGAQSSATEIAAIVFLAARIVHALTYITGIIYIRSAAWMAGIVANSYPLDS